jgi:hypothetical protein
MDHQGKYLCLMNEFDVIGRWAQEITQQARR